MFFILTLGFLVGVIRKRSPLNPYGPSLRSLLFANSNSINNVRFRDQTLAVFSNCIVLITAVDFSAGLCGALSSA